ncbi:hypothetical protein [Chryseobacterium sp. Leaf394]|uniref:hypothetical protein n=1 Tax=Chryseobacterium sp. Leaf394 TaxID=1736361 RepID=UPI000FF89261|nr:hypothetical protein [Chryseobacterium sp. Leaf394]
MLHFSARQILSSYHKLLDTLRFAALLEVTSFEIQEKKEGNHTVNSSDFLQHSERKLYREWHPKSKPLP